MFFRIRFDRAFPFIFRCFFMFALLMWQQRFSIFQTEITILTKVSIFLRVCCSIFMGFVVDINMLLQRCWQSSIIAIVTFLFSLVCDLKILLLRKFFLWQNDPKVAVRIPLKSCSGDKHGEFSPHDAVNRVCKLHDVYRIGILFCNYDNLKGVPLTKQHIGQPCNSDIDCA